MPRDETWVRARVTAGSAAEKVGVSCGVVLGEAARHVVWVVAIAGRVAEAGDVARD